MSGLPPRVLPVFAKTLAHQEHENPAEMLQLYRQVQHREQTEQLEEFQPPPTHGFEDDLPFYEVAVDLSAITATTPYQVSTSGYELVYRRSGSTPAGRILADFGGRQFPLYPGESIRGYFRGMRIFRHPDSATSGPIRLVIVKKRVLETALPVQFRQPTDAENIGVSPVDLLGSFAAQTYVSVGEDTAPSGADPASFLITGWKQIRVFLDGGGANTLTGLTIVPWMLVGSVWFEQRDAAFQITSIGDRFSVFVLEVTGAGSMYLEMEACSPAGLTAVGQIVQGIG